MADPRGPQRSWALVASGLVVALTFALDVTLPLGYAGAFPYVIAVALGLWVPWRPFPFVAAAVASALSLVVLALKPPGSLWWIVIGNRTITLVAMWAIAIAVARYLTFIQVVSDDRARMGAILDTCADGLITIAADGRIELFNRAAERIFGRPAADALGQDVAILMPSPHREAHADYVRRYLATGEPHVIGLGREVEGVRADGAPVPIDLAVAEVSLAGRRVFTASVRDITDRRRAAAERDALITRLEQKNAELERFTYTASHDLKSPLVTIRGFLGTLERSARDGNFERLTADINRIAGAADRMRQLLDDLLELSRIGRVVSPPRALPLGEVVRDALESLDGAIRAGGVQVVVAPDLPVVSGDATRITEVLQNLIENAVKFMGEQPAPRIEIGARDGAGEVVIFVRDNGSGIDPRYHEKIFGLFERLRRDREGTGVGLALVRRIVEVHGGRLWVESAGEGHGSCFCFTLPTVTEESAS